MEHTWNCPYCNHSQIVTGGNRDYTNTDLDIGTSKYGKMKAVLVSVRCLNTGCNEVTISLSIFIWRISTGRRVEEFWKSWPILPQSKSKPQPEYIPEGVKADYYEACLICNLSPKASATLARRCIQGMIRDFCKIVKPTLFKEIAELRRQIDAGTAPRGVQHETMDAIDAVREIGNIGAHMERDIDLIIDVDPGEAQALIALIEVLFQDWYVARYERNKHLENVMNIANQKKAEQKAPKMIEVDSVPQIEDQSKST